VKTLGSTDANPTFMSFDRDFDQVITETEFSAQIERLFTRYDKNKDGSKRRADALKVVEDKVRAADKGEDKAGAVARRASFR